MAQGRNQDYESPSERYRREAKSAFKDTYPHLLHMESSPNLDALIKDLMAFMEKNADGVTSTQLRNIYSKVKPITEANKLKMQRPRLAYIIARQQTDKARLLMHLLDDLIERVDGEKNTVEGFKQFFEAMVAYHKYFEKKS